MSRQGKDPVVRDDLAEHVVAGLSRTAKTNSSQLQRQVHPPQQILEAWLVAQHVGEKRDYMDVGHIGFARL